MNYFNNHRRKLIKKKYIRGTKDTSESNTTSITLENPVENALCSLKIEGNTEQKQMPTPNDPQFVESIEEFELTVKELNSSREISVIEIPKTLESENLLNLKAFVNQTDTASLNEDESVFTINRNGTYAFNGLLRDFCPSIKVGDNITIKFTTTSYEKSIILAGSGIEWKSGQTITVTEDILMSGLLFLCFSGEGNPTEYYNLRIVNADLEKELKFAMLGDYKDTLEIDKSCGKVIYKQVLDRITVPNEKFLGIHRSNGYIGIRADNVLPYKSSYQKGYCSHAQSSNLDISCDYNIVWLGMNDNTVYWTGIISMLGYDNEWADKENPTDSEWSNAQMSFKNWLSEHEANGHHFECVYVLPTPIEHDITDTKLGQKLLNLALPELENVIVEISSDLSPSKISAEYYSKTKEDKHKITVNYEDISGIQIKDSDEHFVRRDSLCKIISPNIDGYEPRNESTIVCAKSDTEITLIYNKK